MLSLFKQFIVGLLLTFAVLHFIDEFPFRTIEAPYEDY